MKTSVIGFPRVGKLRELKFVTEKFFRGEADVAELEKTGEESGVPQRMTRLWVCISSICNTSP